MPADRLTVAVTQALTLMAEVMANPKEITPQLVKAWVLVLRHAEIAPEEIEPAVGRMLSSGTFFPTPADFLKMLRPAEDREASEELAWQSILTTVRRFGARASLTATDLGDATALWALERIGFDRLCRELTEENRAIWRAEFMRLYRAGKSTNAGLEYLPGWFERENLANGHDLTPILAGRPDWKALPPCRAPQQPALGQGQRVLAAVSEVLR